MRFFQGQPKLPGADVLRRVLVRRTAETACSDAGVHGAREAGELHLSHRLAGKVGQALALAGRLHPAALHAKYQPLVAQLDLLFVEQRVETVIEHPGQGRQTTTGLQPQAREDPARLDGGEALPGLGVALDRAVHAVGLLHGQKPQAVVGQPELGGVPQHGLQLLSAEILEVWHTVLHWRRRKVRGRALVGVGRLPRSLL